MLEDKVFAILEKAWNDIEEEFKKNDEHKKMNIPELVIEFQGTTFNNNYRASDWLLHKLTEIDKQMEEDLDQLFEKHKIQMEDEYKRGFNDSLREQGKTGER